MEYRPLEDYPKTFTIFLSGSIEQGTAEHWQDRVVAQLASYSGVILNPRLEKWDALEREEIGNPKFYNQVDWELTGMDRADLILQYFSPNTKSPISLLELGLYAPLRKSHVVCPEGYWRKGNVDMVCSRFGLPTYPDLDSAVAEVKKFLAT